MGRKGRRNLRVAKLQNEAASRGEFKVQRNAFHSEPPPEFPEVKTGPNQGPTPKVGKMGAINTNRFSRLKKDYTDKMLNLEMYKSIVYGRVAKHQRLINKLFPPGFIPLSIETIFSTLRAHVLRNNPTFTERTWWREWLTQLEVLDYNNTPEGPGEEESVTGQKPDEEESGTGKKTKGRKKESREDKLAKLLNRIAEKICELFPELSVRRRSWTSYFHTKSPKNKNSKMPRKPDVVAIDPGESVEDFKTKERLDWNKIKVIVEEKKAAYKGKKHATEVGVDLYNKSYLMFEHQEDRRFVLAFSLTAAIFRLSVLDRSGAIHTQGFDIYDDPMAFLHAFIGLTFAPEDYLGVDTTIETDEDGSRFVTIGETKYKILDTVWRVPMIRGRATTCWLAEVVGTGELVIIKDYWIVVGREPTEVFFLKEAAEAKVEGIPELFDWENVVIRDRLDTTDNNHGVYYPLLDRLHRRMVFKDPADVITSFESKREFLSVILDIVKCLRDLKEAKILHRDISLFNIMIGRDRHPNGLRKGVLIDYDYALDLAKEHRASLLSPVSPEIWPRSLRKSGADSKFCMTMEELDPKERALQKYILSLLEAGKRLRGHRTGTYAFMANQLLINPHMEHTAEFDLESLFYIIVYLGVLQLGPDRLERTTGHIPQFLWNWLHPEAVSAQNLGSLKLALISYSDRDFKELVTDTFSDYMKDIIPCVNAMKDALQKKTVSHEIWISILEKAIKDLPPEVKYDFNVPKATSGVWENTRSRLRHTKLDAAPENPPTGYVSADPNLMTTIEDLPLPVSATENPSTPAHSNYFVDESPLRDLDISAFMDFPLRASDDDAIDELPLPALRISDDGTNDSEDGTVVDSTIAEEVQPPKPMSEMQPNKGKGRGVKFADIEETIPTWSDLQRTGGSRDLGADTKKFESKLRQPSKVRKLENIDAWGSRITQVDEKTTKTTEKTVTTDTTLPLTTINKLSNFSTTTVSSTSTKKTEILPGASEDGPSVERAGPSRIPKMVNDNLKGKSTKSSTKGSRIPSN